MLNNILSVFSAKNREGKLQDYSEVSTDIHSHFIPGIDDGCKTMNDSVALIHSMIEMGFRKLILTPHIMSDNYKNTPEIILNGLEKLKKKLAEVTASCSRKSDVVRKRKVFACRGFIHKLS